MVYYRQVVIQNTLRKVIRVTSIQRKQKGTWKQISSSILYFKREYTENLWKIVTEVSFTAELISSGIQKASSVFKVKGKQYQKLAAEARRKTCKRLRPNTKQLSVSVLVMRAQERGRQTDKKWRTWVPWAGRKKVQIFGGDSKAWLHFRAKGSLEMDMTVPHNYIGERSHREAELPVNLKNNIDKRKNGY